ncbi:SDR family NAD(P)-dependent oxidoreductase [Candidatus Thiosymbion oneisti]|uniref:SDR family NAD(P)-dependent oxidoreductase n=1 Tax=Candidatus Thiosymbion oneisti TaxID=589554 RepID=UPI0010609C8E|nr:SDR family NAD(P)-dependent oxidoreductase [Candidatus Thiosymbion oneisti]
METNDEKIVVMLSGANRGIGEKIAKRLISEGYILSLGARRIEMLQNKFNAFDRNTVLCNWYDAKVPESATKWIDATIVKYGHIDVLINNAGIFRSTTIEEFDEEIVDELWTVNVKGPLRLISLAFPYLKKAGRGKVINLVSLSGKRVKGQSVGYAMSKFALTALTHSVRYSGWEHGIRATAVCPGWVNTQMAEDASRSIIEPKQMTQPEDVATLISTLLKLPNTASISELYVNCVLESSY